MRIYRYQIQVQFNRMKVIDDGDWPGDGEFYWTFTVDNDIVAEKPRAEAAAASDGDVIQINERHELLRNSNQSMTIYGSIGEADGFLAGGDDFPGELVDTFTEKSNWGEGQHSVLVQGNGVSVKVYYTITILNKEQIGEIDH